MSGAGGRAFLVALWFAATAVGARAAGLPERLSETGLYADAAAKQLAPDVVSFTSQYPLWSDGAAKRRWIRIPPGSAIDAADPNAWIFPVGTRVWKEFSFARRVETRYIELAPEGWIFATYRWLSDESDAVLAGERGERAVYEIAPGVSYDLPGRWDCRACHEGNVARLLGFSALQLSGDRDGGAPHAEIGGPTDLDLAAAVARGLVRGLPAELVVHPPRIEAASAHERATLGYLHANCSNCHNSRGPLAALGLSLEVRVDPSGAARSEALATTLGKKASYRPSGSPDLIRLVVGDPAASLLLRRMSRRDNLTQMPPLGSKLVDREAIALVSTWIRDEISMTHFPEEGKP